MALSWIISTLALLFALCVGHGNLVPPPDAENFVCFGVTQVLELRPAVLLFKDDLRDLKRDVYNSVVLIYPPLILGTHGGEILDMNVTVVPVFVSSTEASARELSRKDSDVTVLMAHYTVISTEGGQSFQSLSSLMSRDDNSSSSSPLGPQLTKAIKAHKHGHLCCGRTVTVSSTTFSRYSSGFISSTRPTSSYETSPAQKFALALCFIFITFVVTLQYYILLGETQRPDFVGRWKISASRTESGKSSGIPASRPGSETENPLPRANGSKKVGVNCSLGSNGNGPVVRSSGTVIDGVGEAIKIEENPLHSSSGRRPGSLNPPPRAVESIDGTARISILAASMSQPSQGFSLASPLGPSPTRKSAHDTSSKRASDRLLSPVLPPLPPIPPGRSPLFASGDARLGNGAGRPIKEWGT